MADEKPKIIPKKSPLAGVILFFLILYLMWLFTGGPERNPQSRNHAFIKPLPGVLDGTGETYQESFWGEKGSITNRFPFLR